MLLCLRVLHSKTERKSRSPSISSSTATRKNCSRTRCTSRSSGTRPRSSATRTGPTASAPSASSASKEWSWSTRSWSTCGTGSASTSVEVNKGSLRRGFRFLAQLRRVHANETAGRGWLRTRLAGQEQHHHGAGSHQAHQAGKDQ